MTGRHPFILLLAMAILAGCQNNNISPPLKDCNQSDLNFTATVTNTDCGLATGMLEVIAIGGEQPYSYSLEGGVAQETALFINLATGEYLVKVMDGFGCSTEKIALVANKSGLSVSVSATNSDCGSANGSINVNADSGVEPYQYQLDNEPPQASPAFVVGPGIYNITITDSNGCEFILSQVVKSNTTYTTHVQPIIVNSCAIIGCHDGSNSSLPNYNNFSEVQAGASMIKSRTQSGNMPKTGSLTQNQIDLIACWVDDGALNN